MATVNGDPSYNIDLLNSGGGSGFFRIRDDNNVGADTLRFQIDDAGEVLLTAMVTRNGAIQLRNTSTANNDLLELWSTETIAGPLKRIEFETDDTNDRVVARALEDEAWRFETSDSEGVLVEFANSGGTRLTFAYATSGTLLTATVPSNLQVDVSGSATQDARIIAGRAVYVKVGNDSESGGGLIVEDGADDYLLVVSQDGVTQFWAGGVKYGFFQATDGDAQPTTTLEVGEDTSRGFVRLRADTTDGTQRPGAIIFEPQNTGTVTQVYLYMYYHAGDGKVRLYADNADPSTGPGSVNKVLLGEWTAA